jgi:hypothetical protein
MLADEKRNTSPIAVGLEQELLAGEGDGVAAAVDVGELAKDVVAEGAVARRLEQPGGLDHAVDPGHRVEQADRRVDHQHAAEVEPLAHVVDPGDERRMQPAKAVADEDEMVHLEAGSDVRIGQLHRPIEVVGVGLGMARQVGARRRRDKVGVGRRRQRQHVETGAVEGALQDRHLAAVGADAGTGDDERQRRRAALGDQRKAQLAVVPEDLGHLALGVDRQRQLPARQLTQLRQLRPQRRRRAQDRGHERAGMRELVAVRCRRQQPGRQEQQPSGHRAFGSLPSGSVQG